MQKMWGGVYMIEELSLLLVSNETGYVEDCRGKTYPEALQLHGCIKNQTLFGN